jgi:hypothetical protein
MVGLDGMSLHDIGRRPAGETHTFAAWPWAVPQKAPGGSPGTPGRPANPLTMANGTLHHAESPGSRRGLVVDCWR